MSKPSSKVRLVILLIMLACVLCFSLLGMFEKEIVQWLMPVRGWVEFRVPDDARPIRASIKESTSGLDICNQETSDWRDITVKITGLYGTPYLTRPKPISAGKCEHLPFSEFAEPSWKRMHMPPNQHLSKVEILIRYDASGYASIKLD